VLWPEGAVHGPADRFLRLHDGSGTQRPYAYLLVDHLRWLERECVGLDAVSLRDLHRYMGVVGAEVAMRLGEPWRVGKRPYGKAALSAAACLKGFYLHQAACGVNEALGRQLDRTRLPTRADRNRALLGNTMAAMPSNPLAPRRVLRRHPKMLPEGARERREPAASTRQPAAPAPGQPLARQVHKFGLEARLGPAKLPVIVTRSPGRARRSHRDGPARTRRPCGPPPRRAEAAPRSSPTEPRRTRAPTAPHPGLHRRRVSVSDGTPRWSAAVAPRHATVVAASRA
jgi:hypothetical protein